MLCFLNIVLLGKTKYLIFFSTFKLLPYRINYARVCWLLVSGQTDCGSPGATKSMQALGAVLSSCELY